VIFKALSIHSVCMIILGLSWSVYISST